MSHWPWSWDAVGTYRLDLPASLPGVLPGPCPPHLFPQVLCSAQGSLTQMSDCETAVPFPVLPA